MKTSNMTQVTLLTIVMCYLTNEVTVMTQIGYWACKIVGHVGTNYPPPHNISFLSIGIEYFQSVTCILNV